MEPDTSQIAKPPPVIFWFKIYCGVLCVLYLLVAAAGGVFFFIRPEDVDMPQLFSKVMSVVYLLLGLALFAVCLLPLVVRPRPWVWIYDLIIIALGVSSPCFLPACIPLIIFWVKPETKSYFGRT